MMNEGDNGLSRHRRRHIALVLGAYVAIGWLVVEITSFLLEKVGAPAWSVRLLAIAFVLGAPVAGILAWIFQRKTDSSPGTGQKKAAIAVVMLGVVSTGVLGWLILSHTEEPPKQPNYQPLANSLAILPFALEEATPNERLVAEVLYYALREGLNESPDLRQVRLKPDTTRSDPAAMGRSIRVKALLTGQVYIVRGGIRIDLELLDVARDTVFWTQAVEWDATRVMETGTGVANEVLRSMGLETLSRTTFAGTDKRQAYDALLLAFRHLSEFTTEGQRAAIAEFQRAIDLDPEYINAYLGMAQAIGVYVKLKTPTQEERETLTDRQNELVETAYRLDENNANALSMLGFLSDNHELKIQMYERALEIDPNNRLTYFRLGHARGVEGNLEEAERLFRRALELSPQDANLRADLAKTIWTLGRHEEAMAELEQVVEIDPELVQSYIMLGQWNMFHYGRIDEAIINFRKAYAIDPEVGYVASGIATNYRHLSMKNEAYAWANRALELSPTGAWAWLLVAYVHESFGDEDTAREYYLQSLDLVPRLGIPLRKLGEWDIRNGHWEQARTRWAKAYPELVITSDPRVDERNIDVVQWYAMNLTQAGFKEEARFILNKGCEVIYGTPLGPEDEKECEDEITQLLDPDPDRLLEELRAEIVENRQRVELEFYSHEFDFIRDRPEFHELIRIVEEDLAAQRNRIRLMETNGELPTATGVALKKD